MATEAFAKEELSVTSTTVVSLTPSVYQPSTANPASVALIQVYGGRIRAWWDGSTPTSTSGHLLEHLQTIKLTSTNEIANFRAIGVESGITVTLIVTYEH